MKKSIICELFSGFIATLLAEIVVSLLTDYAHLSKYIIYFILNYRSNFKERAYYNVTIIVTL